MRLSLINIIEKLDIEAIYNKIIFNLKVATRKVCMQTQVRKIEKTLKILLNL